MIVDEKLLKIATEFIEELKEAPQTTICRLN